MNVRQGDYRWRVTSPGSRPMSVALAGFVAACAAGGCSSMEQVRMKPVMASPKVVSRHVPDASSMESVVTDIIRPGMTSEEKALAVWEYCWKHSYHFPAPSEGRGRNHETDVVYDAVKLLNVYGYSYCFAIRSLGEALYEAAGMEARSCGIGGHVIAEVYYDGKYHYLDHDQRGFSRLPDGSIASLEDYRGRARELLFKPTGPSRPFFPSTTRPLVPYEVKHVVAGYLLDQLGHYQQHDKYRTTHSMNLALRPGERFVRYWGSQGKWRCTPGLVAEARDNGYADPWKGPADPYGRLFPESAHDENGNPLNYGNGLLIYRPDLGPGSGAFDAGVLDSENINARGPGFQPARVGSPAHADFRTRLPYVIAGWPGDVAKAVDTTGAAVVSGRCFRKSPADAVQVLISMDNGRSWQAAWESTETGTNEFAVDISKMVEGQYSYLVRFALGAAVLPEDARVLSFGIDTACQLNPAVLPAVRSGENRMTLSLEPGPEVWEETIDYFDGAPTNDPRMVELVGMAWRKESYPCLQPVQRGKPGHVVYRMDAPAGKQIAWARVGAAFRSHWDVSRAGGERFRIFYAEDKPRNWKLAWEADRPLYLGHWCFEANVPLQLSGKSRAVFIKYELCRSTEEKTEGGKLVQARLVWGCGPGNSGETPAVKVSHQWTENGAARKLERVVRVANDSYEFLTGQGAVKNVSISLELADHPPVQEGPHVIMTRAPAVEAKDIGSTNVALLRAAVNRLQEHPDVATAADLLAHTGNGWARNASAAALLGLGGERARAELKKAIGKESRAANCFIEMTGLEAPVAEVMQGLTDGDADVRERAAGYLGRRGDPVATGALEKALGVEKAPDALAAEAAALVRVGGIAKAEIARAALERCDSRGQIEIAGELAAVGDPGGFDVLGKWAGDPNPAIRILAARAMGRSGRGECEASLRVLAADKSHWVRQEAIAGLASCGQAGSLAILATIEQGDPERYLRAEAAWAAGRIRKRGGSPETKPNKGEGVK